MSTRFPIGLGLVLALAGFCCWAAFSLPMFTGRSAVREAWDSTPYWTIGLPLLLLAQGLAGAVASDPAWRWPLWTVGGHFLGVLLIRKTGTDFGLLPLAVVFVGLPLYGALLLAGLAGRFLGRRGASS